MVFVWQERNARVFEKKERVEHEVWDLLHFYSSLWASCTPVFRGVTISMSQLNWFMACNYPQEFG